MCYAVNHLLWLHVLTPPDSPSLREQRGGRKGLSTCN